MNTVEKGRRHEKQCEDDLKAEGCITWRTFRNQYHDLDFFGLFDVAGLDLARTGFRFIQVKSNRVDKKTIERIKAFKMPSNCSKEVWVWKDRAGWTKIYC